MKKIIFTLIVITGCLVMTANDSNFTSCVNPRIGTGGHGHVFLGANVPFGYVQLGPTEHTRGWDWCSGYHTSDSVLIGFGHQHLSGTGYCLCAAVTSARWSLIMLMSLAVLATTLSSCAMQASPMLRWS